MKMILLLLALSTSAFATRIADNLVVNGTTQFDKIQSNAISTKSNTGANVTITSVTTKYMRLTNSALISVSGVDAPANSSVQEIVFYNSTGNNIKFISNGTTTGSPFDLGFSPELTVPNGGSIAFSYNSVGSKWVATTQPFSFANIDNVGEWKYYGVTSIGSTGTAPTKGTVLSGSDYVKCAQLGQKYKCEFNLSQTAGGVTNTGYYYLNLPTGIRYSSTVKQLTISEYSTYGATNTYIASQRIGRGSLMLGSGVTATAVEVVPVAVEGNRVGIVAITASGSYDKWGSTFYQFQYSPSFNFIVEFDGEGLTASTNAVINQIQYSDMKNHGYFSFTLQGNSSPSTVTQSLPFVRTSGGLQQCTRTATGRWECETPDLTVTPKCTASMWAIDSFTGATTLSLNHVWTSTPTKQIFMFASQGTGYNGEFNITCVKQGQDAINAFKSMALAAIKESNLVKDVEVKYKVFVSGNGSLTSPTACTTSPCNVSAYNTGNKFTVTRAGVGGYAYSLPNGSFKPNSVFQCSCTSMNGYCGAYGLGGSASPFYATSDANGAVPAIAAHTGIANASTGAHNGADKAFWIVCEGISPLAQ